LRQRALVPQGKVFLKYLPALTFLPPKAFLSLRIFTVLFTCPEPLKVENSIMIHCCLTPIYQRERRFFDKCIPSMRLRNNGSNVGLSSLLQILVIQGDGEGEKGDRKDRK